MSNALLPPLLAAIEPIATVLRPHPAPRALAAARAELAASQAELQRLHRYYALLLRALRNSRK